MFVKNRGIPLCRHDNITFTFCLLRHCPISKFVLFNIKLVLYFNFRIEIIISTNKKYGMNVSVW